MRFWDKLVLKQDVDRNSMINAIICSMLESPPTYDGNEMRNGVYKSTHLEPTIKYLIKETRFCRTAACNLVRRVHNIRA